MLSSYVFPDQLISPVNGYSCKQINKQNIKQFGFTSVEELQLAYPGFPTRCETVETVRLAHMKIGVDTFSKQRKEDRLSEYSESPSICECCNATMPFEKRHNRYCSKSCAAHVIRKMYPTHKSTKCIILVCVYCGNTFTNNAHGSTKLLCPDCKKIFSISPLQLTQRLDAFKNFSIAEQQILSQDPNGPYTRIFYNTCKLTGKLFIGPGHRKYHPDAYADHKSYYAASGFRFNIYSFPLWFRDADILIEKYGWYSTPGSRKGNLNLNGISRDHMLSRADAWIQRIDPVIIRNAPVHK